MLQMQFTEEEKKRCITNVFTIYPHPRVQQKMEAFSACTSQGKSNLQVLMKKKS